ncbi:nuclear shuttle protein [Rhynchosia yellow mosaic India virus]|uniref:Nuclear shuttle protein n=1 Tax=Rhynchosia yellow mosaic India virus TaxID=935473 RepID=E7CWM3_9GEMI|nr:nuclear shuttle protein [Rhynchosia yellow mosaic India virus]ADU02168.1 nuclear shuttle protein [Rhynchosia yellow mosaic India virus]
MCENTYCYNIMKMLSTNTPSNNWRSPFRRNTNYRRGGRIMNTPSRFKIRVARRLSYGKVERPLQFGKLCEKQHGIHMSLSSNRDITSFISYPPLSFDGDGRSRDYIKLLSLTISGMISARVVSGDQPMDNDIYRRGMFVISLILDRKPYIAEGANELPSFEELFGQYSESYVNMRLLPSRQDRFRLLGTIKKNINCDSGAADVNVGKYIRFVQGRRTLWSRFKDPDPMESGGNYRNIATNAILVNYAFISMQHITVNPLVQFELNYVG